MPGDEELRVHAEEPMEYRVGPETEQPARPAGAAPEIKTYHRVQRETRAQDAPPKVAVIVCHGMGQQVPYETIDMIAGSLLGGAGAGAANSHVRQVKFGDDLLGRAEITVERDGHKREVHLYESYWAPLTAGKVTLRDVAWFLLQAAFFGLIAMAKAALKGSLGFDRWMFGGFRWMRVRVVEVVSLLLALLVISSLILLYGAFAWSVLAYLLGGGIQSFGPQLVQYLRTTLVAFAAMLVVGAAALFILWLCRRSLRPGFVAGILNSAILLVAFAVLLCTCGLGFCVLVLYGHHVFVTFGSAEPGCITRMLTLVYNGVTRFEDWVACVTQRHSRTWFYAAAAFLGLVFTVGRSFLIEYVGDVTAYVAAHTVSKFYELRSQIQLVAFKVFNAVYGAQVDGHYEYETIVVTGHSLGSVLTYDTLNAFLNYDVLLQNNKIDVLRRTPMLVTFGSPLDKTAFLFRNQLHGAIFREALAATKQPMILTYDARPARWVNIYNHADWFSGSLENYDDPLETDPARLRQMVQNVEDREGFFPLLAHTEYPGHPELREYLMQGIFRVPR
jgi:hypothetical protein